MTVQTLTRLLQCVNAEALTIVGATAAGSDACTTSDLTITCQIVATVVVVSVGDTVRAKHAAFDTAVIMVVVVLELLLLLLVVVVVVVAVVVLVVSVVLVVLVMVVVGILVLGPRSQVDVVDGGWVNGDATCKKGSIVVGGHGHERRRGERRLALGGLAGRRHGSPCALPADTQRHQFWIAGGADRTRRKKRQRTVALSHEGACNEC